jgi:hypothetical protein
LLIGNERCTRCSSPATLIFRSSHSFITLSSSAQCIDILTINCSDMPKSTVNSPMWRKTYFKKYK